MELNIFQRLYSYILLISNTCEVLRPNISILVCDTKTARKICLHSIANSVINEANELLLWPDPLKKNCLHLCGFS